MVLANLTLRWALLVELAGTYLGNEVTKWIATAARVTPSYIPACILTFFFLKSYSVLAAIKRYAGSSII